MNAIPSIPRTTMLDALKTLGLPDIDYIMQVIINGDFVTIQQVGPKRDLSELTTKTYRVVEECPSCHTADGHPHTDYCQRPDSLDELIHDQMLDAYADRALTIPPGSLVPSEAFVVPNEDPNDAPPEIRELAERMIADEIANDPSAAPLTGIEVRRTPDEWAQREGTLILDADGWAGANGRPYTDLISHPEYIQRRNRSTCRFPAHDAGLLAAAGGNETPTSVEPVPWVDNGCRCPNPDHEHRPGCPVLADQHYAKGVNFKPHPISMCRPGWCGREPQP